MKKVFSFLIVGLLVTGMANAQTRVRKVPFLPYAGSMTGVSASGQYGSTSAGATSNQPFKNKPISKPYETVFFNEGSSELRPDQAQKLVKIGKRLEREGGAFYTVVSFSTPEISSSLAGARANTVTNALKDFNVGDPVYKYEYRKRSVVNPNRIEIYMK